MKTLSLFFALCFGLLSCVSSHNIELSRLTVNSKCLNKRIVDRHLDYGDGRKDGCIVMREMHLYLNTKAKGKLLGRVTAVDDYKGLANASLTLGDKFSTIYLAVSDSVGNFQIDIEEQLASVKVQYVGFRTLSANF